MQITCLPQQLFDVPGLNVEGKCGGELELAPVTKLIGRFRRDQSDPVFIHPLHATGLDLGDFGEVLYLFGPQMIDGQIIFAVDPDDEHKLTPVGRQFHAPYRGARGIVGEGWRCCISD